ncbi:MAG: LysO family transporter [Desulfovibrio sp.]|nr:LysO family transporter [Desulfovibrio sp.]
MFLPISCIFIGIALGLLLKRTALPKLADRLFMPIVCALLFAMGYVTGGNAELMANLPTLGLQALLLAGATIVGSVLCVCLTGRFLPSPEGGFKGGAKACAEARSKACAAPSGKGRPADCDDASGRKDESAPGGIR